MLVQPKQVIFGTKKRFATPQVRKNMDLLLDKMGKTYEYTDKDYYYRMSFLKTLSTKDKSTVFHDGRTHLKNINFNEPKGKAMIVMDKTTLVIDNNTGEIVNFKKPFYKPWKNVMKKLNNSLMFFLDNFNNRELVQRKMIDIEGLTKKGWDEFNRIC